MMNAKRLILNFIIIISALAYAVACTSAPEADPNFLQTQDLYVAPETAECVGVVVQQCLQVRSNVYADWEFFYDQIEGFDYEPGYTYLLRVDTYKVENPPADASDRRYVLVEIVSKE